jgi:hypothetical protein
VVVVEVVVVEVVPGEIVVEVVVEVEVVVDGVVVELVDVEVLVGTVVIDVVELLVEVEVFGLVVVVLVDVDVVVVVAGLVVVVDAATVVGVLGAAMFTVTLDEPETDVLREYRIALTVSAEEPRTLTVADPASMPDAARVSLDEPSIAMSAMLPGAKVMDGCVGVFPLSASSDDPLIRMRAPTSFEHVRTSLLAVPQVRMRETPVPVTLDEFKSLNPPEIQYVPGCNVIFDEPVKVSVL